MPNITLPHRAATDIQDGLVTSAPNLAENFYSPATTPDSFDVMNGQLDNANRAAGWTVDRTHIQPGALGRGGSAGSTLNLDYFGSNGDVFGAWAVGNDLTGLYLPIPGACRTFYLPFNPAVLLVTWRMFAAPDGEDTRAQFRMYKNGAQITNQMRTVHGGDPAGSGRSALDWDRTWSGFHYEATPGAGWYTFGLYVASNNPTTRVRCRGIDYSYFW